MPIYINKTVITCKTFYNLILSFNNLYIHIDIQTYKYYAISLNVLNICLLKTEVLMVLVYGHTKNKLFNPLF